MLTMETLESTPFNIKLIFRKRILIGFTNYKMYKTKKGCVLKL